MVRKFWSWQIKVVIENQTPEICLEAVRQNGLALQYVKNKAEDICLEAVNRCRDAIKYVTDPKIVEKCKPIVEF